MNEMIIKGVCRKVLTIDKTAFPDVKLGDLFTVEEIDSETGEITTHPGCQVELIDEFSFTVVVA